MKQEMMGWQWHQLDHMQIIGTSLQTDDHASTSALKIVTGRIGVVHKGRLQQGGRGVGSDVDKCRQGGRWV